MADKIVVAAGWWYGPWHLEERDLGQIASVSSRVEVRAVGRLFEAWWKLQRQGSPASSANLGQVQQDLDKALGDAEVVFARAFPWDLLSRAPRLRWVQLSAAGIDYLRRFDTGLLESGVLVSNARGLHAIPIAEHVLQFILMFAKQANLLFAHKEAREWGREGLSPQELGGKTVGIVGLGSIGTEVARLARAFGMEVVATRRSAREREYNKGDVDELVPPSELPYLLGRSDFVVLTLPLTQETAKLIGRREMEAMRPTAYLINVSRGGIVDEEALVRALKEGWIAGAGLDVFEREPLPAESPLWDMPNVILTPHVAGATDRYRDRATRLFCENLVRYVTGKPLLNLVDRTRGY